MEINIKELFFPSQILSLTYNLLFRIKMVNLFLEEFETHDT